MKLALMLEHVKYLQRLVEFFFRNQLIGESEFSKKYSGQRPATVTRISFASLSRSCNSKDIAKLFHKSGDHSPTRPRGAIALRRPEHCLAVAFVS